tara:strand:+ start:4477 stop:4638 length:162 start_codon:yes stop_codon:yes gene_type:complete
MRLTRSEKQVERLEETLADPGLPPENWDGAERALAGARLLLKHRKARQQASRP